MYKGYLTDIEGILVGHSQDQEGLTGCTVVIAREGAVAGVDVRGSGPGTRETDIFDCRKTVDRVHAIVLSGGSAFGLNSAGGVMNYLEEEGVGFDVGLTKVPIVPAAVIFDLQMGDYRIRPDEKMGYEAARSATRTENRQGNIGAGLGASVGKYLGKEKSMKSGLGSATVELGQLKVSALVVVNAIGDIFDLEGRQIAGIYDYEKGQALSSMEVLRQGQLKNTGPTNTTIGVVATNGKLNKGQANKLAEMSHNGYARVINPIHTSLDGDTIFALSSNEVEANIDLIGSLATEAVSKAIINAIVNAESIDNIKAHRDLFPG